MKDAPSDEEEEAMKSEEEENMKVEDVKELEEQEDDSFERNKNYDHTNTASDIPYEVDNQDRNMRPRRSEPQVLPEPAESMPEVPPAQSRTSTAQSAMTIMSIASAAVEDDDSSDLSQMTFEPHDTRFGKAISCAKHGPYYMHMGDRLRSICFQNLTTFMCRLCGRYQCMPCHVSKTNLKCECSIRYITTFDESHKPDYEHELSSIIDPNTQTITRPTDFPYCLYGDRDVLAEYTCAIESLPF